MRNRHAGQAGDDVKMKRKRIYMILFVILINAFNNTGNIQVDSSDIVGVAILVSTD